MIGSIIICCMAVAVCAEDVIVPNKTYKTSSSSGRYFIEMIPKTDYGEDGEGLVTRYDSDKVLWRVDWFSWLVVLCNDGTHLARLGDWSTDRENLTDLAVAFYEKDKLIRKYLVKDLIKNRSKLELTSSHYFWKANVSTVPFGFSKDNKAFNLTTIDGSVYEFDASTGHIISTRKDPGVKGYLQ
ncbi:MAG: hypothetical protein V1893_00205 [Candidatus Omnitrophota bacterium]